MFRVHGATRLGRWYRLIVVVANMMFGLLSGLEPLVVSVGPIAVFAQTAIVLLLQLSMAVLCFRILPDADRIISRFAATQFLLEGTSTASLLGASISEYLATNTADSAAGPANAADAIDTATDPETVGSLSGTAAATWAALRDSGFYLALAAMFVPMVQLLEQRVITLCINVVKNRGGNPLALLAAFYLLAASLPKKMVNMVRYWMGYENLKASSATASATANAGDDATEAEIIEEESSVRSCEVSEPC